MANPSTYIKLDRNILKWEWYKNQNTKALFLHLLLKANIEDKDFNGTTVHRGELITSLQSLSEELGMTKQNVRTAIKHLKSTGELKVIIKPNYSKIIVINYSKYQDIIVSFGRPKTSTSKTSKPKKQSTRKSKSSVPKPVTIDKDYVPKEWEKDIPDRFWGRFDNLEEWKLWCEQ